MAKYENNINSKNNNAINMLKNKGNVFLKVY